MDLKEQYFGTEIEMTGITREEAANAVGELFGTQPYYIGTYYSTWGVRDLEGKEWKFTYDKQKNGRSSEREHCRGKKCELFEKFCKSYQTSTYSENFKGSVKIKETGRTCLPFWKKISCPREKGCNTIREGC